MVTYASPTMAKLAQTASGEQVKLGIVGNSVHNSIGGKLSLLVSPLEDEMAMAEIEQGVRNFHVCCTYSVEAVSETGLY